MIAVASCTYRCSIRHVRSFAAKLRVKQHTISKTHKRRIFRTPPEACPKAAYTESIAAASTASTRTRPSSRREVRRLGGSYSINPFRTAVPFWGQSSLILSSLSPQRDSGSKRVNNQNHNRSHLMCKLFAEKKEKKKKVLLNFGISTRHLLSEQVCIYFPCTHCIFIFTPWNRVYISV